MKLKVYKFYVELEGFEPMVWRRFEIDGKSSLAKLGYVLMTLFEMKAEHLFEFHMRLCDDSKVVARFEDNEIDWQTENVDYIDVVEKRICDLIDEDTKEINFVYDFGDNWTLKLNLEGISDADSAKDYPRVTEGEGFGIIENVGGAYALADMVEIFKTKSDGYEEFAEWLDTEELNIETFDINDMNFRLKKIPRILKDIYEFDLEPTQYSIDILEREYLKK